MKTQKRFSSPFDSPRRNTFVIGGFLLLLAFFSTTQSNACSLVPPDTNLMRNTFRYRIAFKLGLLAASVPTYSITQPKVTFLKPIGGDCSGLDAAFHSAGYYFKKSYPNKTCTHQGVVINKGYSLGASSPIEVQDSTACVGIPIGPTPNFAGNWINRNASTNFITAFTVRHGATQIRVSGKCHPTDCDWGIVSLLATGSPRTKRAIYRQGNRTRTLYLSLNASGSEIVLRTVTQVSTPSGTTSSTRVDNFVRR